MFLAPRLLATPRTVSVGSLTVSPYQFLEEVPLSDHARQCRNSRNHQANGQASDDGGRYRGRIDKIRLIAIRGRQGRCCVI